VNFELSVDTSHDRLGIVDVDSHGRLLSVDGLAGFSLDMAGNVGRYEALKDLLAVVFGPQPVSVDQDALRAFNLELVF